MYEYRRLTREQQLEVIEYRRQQRRPLHAPPHWKYSGQRQFILTATCFDHANIIGASHRRMTACETQLLEIFAQYTSAIYAWCILPNHYHVLIRTDQIEALRHELGLYHGRSSNQWNSEDNQRGRQVFHNCFERPIRSNGHFHASVNYIHHNPVKHGHVDKWQDWPWSSATDYLARVGRETAEKIWRKFPLLDYGMNWDIDTEGN